MKILLCHITFFVIAVLRYGEVHAQDTTTTDFFDKIKNYDISKVIASDSFLVEDTENGKQTFKREEILGFIGNNHQRFFIHFNTVKRNPLNLYEYIVTGKTKVNGTKCSFQGKIKIYQARLYNTVDIPTYKEGSAICEVNLFENKKQPHSGFIKGILTSNFMINEKGQLSYDVIWFGADGFNNNQFIGNWTSYKTKESKKCNWGDYRIPECNWINGCDIGAGEFSISQKYSEFGWNNYIQAYSTYPETKSVILARKKEKFHWWK